MSDEPKNCPHCEVSLMAEAIPDDVKENYSGTHWKREMGVTVRGHGDRTNYYVCPDCNGRWSDEPEDYVKFCKAHNVRIKRKLKRSKLK